VAAEGKSAYYAQITITRDAVEVAVGGSNGDGSITDIEHLLALCITAAAAVRGVLLLGS
jgi:hypothetical protein